MLTMYAKESASWAPSSGHGVGVADETPRRVQITAIGETFIVNQ
jgi:hypothetical protein